MYFDEKTDNLIKNKGIVSYSFYIPKYVLNLEQFKQLEDHLTLTIITGNNNGGNKYAKNKGNNKNFKKEDEKIVYVTLSDDKEWILLPRAFALAHFEYELKNSRLKKGLPFNFNDIRPKAVGDFLYEKNQQIEKIIDDFKTNSKLIVIS